jgi:glutathione S-transferase
MSQQTEYVLYGSMKNRGGRVIWALEELEQTYELVDLKLFEGEQRTPNFQAINPHGKVPVLIIHDGNQGSSEVVTESLAILYVLAERHQSLLPPSPHSRALCHHWLAYCATELEPPLWMHAKHTFVYSKKRRVEAILPSCLYEYQRALNHIEKILSDGRDYVLEDGFSLADIYVGQTLMWGRSRSMGTLGDFTEAYIKRLKGRPAWRRAIATIGPKENT